jgi:hypothetical protein
MPGNFNKLQTVSTGDTITAELWNGEFDNIISNFDPEKMDDASASTGAFQTVENPYPGNAVSLPTTLTGEIRRLRHMIKAITGETYWYEQNQPSLSSINTIAPPVGTILAHYDFDGNVTVSNNYLYCNGQTVSDGDSPIDGEVLPDLSGRYLVGFGGDGDGTLDSAAWNTTVVGAANHQVNLQHAHTLTHTHVLTAHNHGLGNGHTDLSMSYFSGTNKIMIGGKFKTVTSRTLTNIAVETANVNTNYNSVTSSIAIALGGNTNTSGSLVTNTGNTSTTNSSLSTTQSIQPRSVRVRYIIRIK